MVVFRPRIICQHPYPVELFLKRVTWPKMLRLLALCHQAAGNKHQLQENHWRVTIMQPCICDAPYKQSMSYGTFCLTSVPNTGPEREKHSQTLVIGQLQYSWESVLKYLWHWQEKPQEARKLQLKGEDNSVWKKAEAGGCCSDSHRNM